MPLGSIFLILHQAVFEALQEFYFVDFPLKRDSVSCPATPPVGGGNINSPAGRLLHIPKWDQVSYSSYLHSVSCLSIHPSSRHAVWALSYQHPFNRSSTQGEDQSKEKLSFYIYEITVKDISVYLSMVYFLPDVHNLCALVGSEWHYNLQNL